VAENVEFQNPFRTRPILGINVVVSNYDELVETALAWAREQQSRALYFAAVHMIMEAVDDQAFASLMNDNVMIFPDGMPLTWALRLLGESSAKRITGPDTVEITLAKAEKAGVSVGFYGGSEDVLNDLLRVVRQRHPKLHIAYFESPPFRVLTPEEDAAVVERIAASGACLLFVGLGCPKQERWIMEHLGRVNAVMFAVGAAFDFISGNKRRAPRWMRNCGLEWVFRMMMEPRRLAMRYLKHNPRFVIRFVQQLMTRQA
jgi:N-acetylglucosaminyldiphosphoundecaprenol N-acetyl-beta-D-mannosaminyltransferase